MPFRTDALPGVHFGLVGEREHAQDIFLASALIV